MTSHRLVVTDIVQAIPWAAVVGLGHQVNGMLDWGMLVNRLIGTVLAVLSAGLLTRRLSGRRIQMTLVLVLMAAGVKVLLELSERHSARTPTRSGLHATCA